MTSQIDARLEQLSRRCAGWAAHRGTPALLASRLWRVHVRLARGVWRLACARGGGADARPAAAQGAKVRTAVSHELQGLPQSTVTQAPPPALARHRSGVDHPNGTLSVRSVRSTSSASSSANPARSYSSPINISRSSSYSGPAPRTGSGVGRTASGSSQRYAPLGEYDPKTSAVRLPGRAAQHSGTHVDWGRASRIRGATLAGNELGQTASRVA